MSRITDLLESLTEAEAEELTAALAKRKSAKKTKAKPAVTVDTTSDRPRGAIGTSVQDRLSHFSKR